MRIVIAFFVVSDVIFASVFAVCALNGHLPRRSAAALSALLGVTAVVQLMRLVAK